MDLPGSPPIYLDCIDEIVSREEAGIPCETHLVFENKKYKTLLWNGDLKHHDYEKREIGIYKNVVFYPYLSSVISNNRVIRETTMCDFLTRYNMHFRRFYKNFPIRDVAGVCTSIQHGYQMTNHSHYMTECLSRIYSLHKVPCLSKTKLKMINTKKLNVEELAVLSELIPKNVEIEHASPEERIRAEEYCFLPFLVKFRAHFVPQEVQDFMNQIVPAALGAKIQSSWPKKIYVSRKKARYRRVVNEEEVAAALKKKGYETVVFEDLSLKDQISMSLGVTHVVGLHGSGFANLMYAPPGGALLEIFPGFKNETDFEYLAHCRGLRYHFAVLNYHSAHVDCVLPLRKLMPMVKQMESS